MFDLSGKNALVTGASGGIGAEIARQLVMAGARVGISGTRMDALSDLKQEIGASAFVLPCDLSDLDMVGRLVKTASDKLGGPIDILVNNAGINRDNLFMRMPQTDWDTVIKVNLTAAVKLCQDSIRPMMKARWGRIINISSIIGATGNAGQTNYAAAKAGIIGFSKSLAMEVASRGITVNSIAPGVIKTAMTDKLSQAQRDAFLTRIPVGRAGSPNEIAAAVVYLASVEAGYITGTTLHINGGMAMI